MDLSLLSGVVRNRKVTTTARSGSEMFAKVDQTSRPPASTMEHIIDVVGRNNWCRKFTLRVHKFSFQWDLFLHLSVCLASLCPFSFTGDRTYIILPGAVWAFYHILFLLGPRQANLVIPGFGKFKQSFKQTVEEFFSPKLLPVLSISFLLVALSLGVTGHRLGGAPLCYHPCGTCLAQWSHSIALSDPEASEYAPYQYGCGYANGKELLGYYTMAQTSFLLFAAVVVAMAVCLAWRVADEEKEERNQAEAWLKRESPQAYELRNDLIAKFGTAGSAIRPEGGPVWVFFGVTAAITFTLLGWHNWSTLSPSHSATLLIVLNLMTIIMTTLVLHLGFFGRLLALYKRNYGRVHQLTVYLSQYKQSHSQEKELEAWWNCRNFVLNDDLSLDYDIGGLAVSATFLINVFVFFILLAQMIREGGFLAMLEAPGSYCAYACMYITACLIKIFSLATSTYEEQHRHIAELQALQPKMDYKEMLDRALAAEDGVKYQENAHYGWVERTEDLEARDDGPIFIDEATTPREKAPLFHSTASSHMLTAMDAFNENGGKATKLAPPKLPSSPGRRLDETGSWFRPKIFSNPMSGLSAVPNSLHVQISDLESAADGPTGGIYSRSRDEADERFSSKPKESEGLTLMLPSAVPAPVSISGVDVTKSPARPPPATRQTSFTSENYRLTIIEIVSQIRKYDPYPCILGIPVMPALFSTCKFYIFISFLLIGVRTMVSCFRVI